MDNVLIFELLQVIIKVVYLGIYSVCGSYTSNSLLVVHKPFGSN